MAKSGNLERDVNFDELAELTKNYTGAEIESVCRGAAQRALFKESDLSAFGGGASQASGKQELPKVKMDDFRYALTLNKPQFGVDDQSLENCIRDGIYTHGDRFTKVYETIDELLETVKNTDTPLLSLLLEGQNGCGKTALAAHLATKSEFPFVKMISPHMFVGKNEYSKI